MWDRYLERVVAGLADPAARREAAEEMAAHLDALVEEGLAAGLAPPQAVSRALQRFGKSESLRRAWAGASDTAPHWPVVAWAAGLALAALPIWGGLGIATASPGLLGPSAWFLIWAVVFGAFHWRSFRAVLRGRPEYRRLMPPGWWRAWPFAAYGAAVGASAVRMWPWFHDGGPLWLPFAVGLVGWLLCRWLVGAEPLSHPLGSALAALGAWTVMAAVWTVYPARMAAPWGEPVTPLSLSVLLAALLFIAGDAVAFFSRGARPPTCLPDPAGEGDTALDRPAVPH